MRGEPDALETAAGLVCRAVEDIGFFGIADHGVADEVVADAFAASARFHALPLDAKLAVKINASHRGYMPMADQHRAEAAKANLSESFLVGAELAADDPDVLAAAPMCGLNQWPAELPDIRAPLAAYRDAMTALGRRMLGLFETALEVPDGFFQRCFTKPLTFVRALHYPPAPAHLPPDQFGAAPHSDFGFITMLAQDDVGGLQVRTRAGDWIDAPNMPGVFIVNVGDMLMRWTNDRFVSTLHRVLNAPGRDRYSLPFFFDPDVDTVVECIDSCRGPGNPPRYAPIVWGDYLTERFNANHKYRKPDAA
jgi:isopenicillin N synthase-like dioxygenase